MHRILFIYLLAAVGKCWDLNQFGIGQNYYVSSIAIYRARAFLALPRSVCHNNISNPTVIEVPWIGNYKQPSVSVTAIKNPRLKILEYQKLKKCKDIQDAISLAMEPKKPKLWILDKGNEFCEPKILSYSVIYNIVSEISILKKIPGQHLNVITIDPQPTDFGHRMYIGNAGDDTLLVFSSESLKWWKLNLREMDNAAVSIKADFLTISKTDPVLYITGKTDLELFSLNLNQIRNADEPFKKNGKKRKDMQLVVNTTLVGQKLGMSTGLETDFKSGLNYYMIRDYVIVRWLIGSPLSAEHHNVLAQSYEQLPYVTDLFTGSQYGLWALVNPFPPEECLEGVNDTTPKLESRVVKILKYNKFLDDIFN